MQGPHFGTVVEMVWEAQFPSLLFMLIGIARDSSQSSVPGRAWLCLNNRQAFISPRVTPDWCSEPFRGKSRGKSKRPKPPGPEPKAGRPEP